MSMKQFAAPEFDALYRVADEWTRQQTEAFGRFGKKDLERVLRAHCGGGALWTYQEVAAQILERMPDVVHIDPNTGYARGGVVSRAYTLGFLLQEACACIDPDHKPPSGRRATPELSVINQQQFEGMRRAAELASEMITGDPKRLEKVGREHFVWIPNAGEVGRGEWELVTRIGAFSNTTAAAKYDTKRRPEDPSWHPEMNAERRKKYEQGIRNLLNLACTLGLITRGDAGERLLPVHAAEWNADVDDLRAALHNGHRSHDVMRDAGVRTLARFASSLGYLTSAETNWERVHQAIEKAMATQNPPLKYNLFAGTRQCYTELREAGLVHGPHWPKKGEDRMSLFPIAEVRRAVAQLDCSDLRLPDGRYPIELCEGTYGLDAYLRWVTQSPSSLREAGLPPRAWPDPSAEQRVELARNPNRFKLRPTSLLVRVNEVNHHAGFCARHLGVDFTVTGLDAVCKPENVRAHARHRHPHLATGLSPIEDSQMSRLADGLAAIASPFLEARAIQQRDHALEVGDFERAADLATKGQRLRENSAELRVLAAEYLPKGDSRRWKRQTDDDGEDRDVVSPRDIQLIWQIWTADNVSGWHKLGILRDALIQEVEQLGWRCSGQRGTGSLPIPEQVSIIQTDRDRPRPERVFRPRTDWAVAVRNAVLVGFLQRIPLRATNVIELEWGDWRNVVPHRQGPVERWEGAIHLKLSAEQMKGCRPFSPPLLLARDLYDPVVLKMVRPDLIQLYAMVGGAREALLCLPSGSARMGLPTGFVVPSPYVFPAVALTKLSTRINQTNREEWIQSGMRLGRSGLAATFKKLLYRYASVLNIDVAALTRIHGATTPHVVRHLFGSHHCDPSRWEDAIGPEQASKMLHHSTVAFTMARYCGVNEQQVSIRSLGPSATSRSDSSGTFKSSAYTDAIGRLVDRFAQGEIDRAQFEEQRGRIESLMHD